MLYQRHDQTLYSVLFTNTNNNPLSESYHTRESFNRNYMGNRVLLFYFCKRFLCWLYCAKYNHDSLPVN